MAPKKKSKKKVSNKSAAKKDKTKKARSMTQSQAITTMAERMDMDKKTVKEFFEKYAELVVEQAPKGFPLMKLGKVVLKDRKARKARMGRNPQTSEEIEISAKPKIKNIPKFRISKAFKVAIAEEYGGVFAPVDSKKKKKKKKK